MSAVCVTGANGFIATHIVEQLLAKGYTVHGTVRDPADAKKTAHLRALDPTGERLRLFAADLLNSASFDAAVAGCSCVMHTASPYSLKVEDPQRDLVEPAERGTENVLMACLRARVPKVIVTSSVAAITDEPDKRVSEVDWNEKSSLTRNPYYYSKVRAERRAWEIVKQHPHFKLVVINPFVVIGPAHAPEPVNGSNEIFVNLYTGGFPAIIKLAWGMVDVRDVAAAHVLAMEKDEASGRYICANQSLWMREVIDQLKQDFPAVAGRLPSRALDCCFGSSLAKLGSRFEAKGVGDYLRTNIDKFPRYDNSKIRRDLGLEFRPLDASIREAVADLMRKGHIPEARH